MRVAIFIVVVMAASLAVARADTITTINFDQLSPGGAGPALFRDAGAAQTVNIPDVASISGGVVLGLAPGLAANPYAAGANIYATASDDLVGVGGFGLPGSIVINIPSGTYATQATVPVINGMQSAENYTVTAYDDGTVVSRQVLSDVQSYGYAVATLTASAMTSIKIAPVAASSWDFGTDNITLNESSQQSHITETPEPGSAFLAIAGFAIAGAAASLRRRYCSLEDTPTSPQTQSH